MTLRNSQRGRSSRSPAVRVATVADVPSLFDVRTSVVENYQSVEELARLGVTLESVADMLRSNSRAWVGEEDDHVVAFSMANAAEATVFAMFVRPGSDGQGWGRALMIEAEHWLFDRGCEEIWLLTDGPAISFYQHLGWRNEGVQTDGQTRFTKRRDSA